MSLTQEHRRRAVVNIEGFERLEMDGNSIPAGILDEIQNLFENHGKTLGGTWSEPSQSRQMPEMLMCSLCLG